MGRWHQSCSNLVRSCPRRVWHHCRSPFKRDLLCKKHRSSDCLSERACTPTRKRKQARALPHTACRRQISPVVLHLKKLRASMHCDGDLFCFVCRRILYQCRCVCARGMCALSHYACVHANARSCESLHNTQRPDRRSKRLTA